MSQQTEGQFVMLSLSPDNGRSSHVPSQAAGHKASSGTAGPWKPRRLWRDNMDKTTSDRACNILHVIAIQKKKKKE